LRIEVRGQSICVHANNHYPVNKEGQKSSPEYNAVEEENLDENLKSHDVKNGGKGNC